MHHISKNLAFHTYEFQNLISFDNFEMSCRNTYLQISISFKNKYEDCFQTENWFGNKYLLGMPIDD